MSHQLVPKAVVTQWLREAVGEDVMIHKETLDWVSECAEEFVLQLGAAANEIAEEAASKEHYRISSDDVTAALEACAPAWLLPDLPRLGLQAYVEEIKAQQSKLEQESQAKKQRIASRKAAAKSAMATHDELLAEQNALFQQASRKAAREGW